MKQKIRNICNSITIISCIFLSFGVNSATNSSSSNDQWIAHCLTEFDKGSATDDCLNMGGIYTTKQIRTKGFKILLPEASESLKLTLAPSSRPVPLIFGHYWRCINPKDSEFESCEPVLVVCTDDQSWCNETP